MYLGIHQSFTGLDCLVSDAKSIDANTFQFFIRNNRNCSARVFQPWEFAYFNTSLLRSDISNYVLHASYAMNPATYKPELRERTKSIILSDMLLLSKMAGIKKYVLHPGAYTDGSPVQAMDNLISLLHEISDKQLGVQICLETMGGQGTQIMSDLQSIKYVLEGISDLDNVGLCIDTCHYFVAGIINTDLIKFIETLPKDYIGVVHLNGTNNSFGSRVDRHASLFNSKLPVNIVSELISVVYSLNNEACFILETPSDCLLQDFFDLKVKCKTELGII